MNIQKSTIARAAIHIAVILLALLFPYLIEFQRIDNFAALLFNPFAIRYFFSFGFLTFFVYFNYLWLVEKYYFQRKFFTYALWLAASLIIIFYLPELAAYGLGIKTPAQERITKGDMSEIEKNKSIFNLLKLSSPEEHGDKMPNPPPPGGRPTSPKINVIILFFLSIFLTISILADKRLQSIENDKLSAELAHLKAQINPHFLFNTLNGIYSLVIKNDKKAGESVLKLSELMRYILQDAQKTHVPLDKEISFINSYIALQKQRLTEYMALNYTLEGVTSGKKIAPLLLITFIENAFKHGINPDEDCVIDIHIHIGTNDLLLKVFNKKVPLAPNQWSSGIGLANVKERLQMLYATKHNLTVTDDDTSYLVELKLIMT
ncbi:MAG: histidine kinase [Saprospiraceae bacterium]|nr:histidine kinase [Saprospiraceae bacterium]